MSTHAKLKYPLAAAFGALPKSIAAPKDWVVYDPYGQELAIMDSNLPDLNKARALWVAQALTLALFQDQNPGLDVPIPVNADQAQLMALVGINWLKDHAPERLVKVGDLVG